MKPLRSARGFLLLLCLLITAGCGWAPTGPEEGRGQIGAEKTQPAGTLHMAERLAAIRSNATVMDSAFDNHRRLELLLELSRPDDPAEGMRHDLELAGEFLRAGHSAEAALRFVDGLQWILADPSAHPEGLARRVRTELATAYLRLGEQQNCIDSHNVDSCLLPISGSGVHRVREGSEKALEQLARLLEEDPDDVVSLWLYNLAAMTLGLYPEQVPADWRIAPETFDSDQEMPRLHDVAPAVGLGTVGPAGSAVVDDFDGDGRLDLVVSAWGYDQPLRFFHNASSETGRLSFEQRTAAAGFEGLNGGLNLIHGDVDNDGDLDLFVLRGAWRGRRGQQPNSLLLGDGRGFFEDVTEAAGVLSFRPTQVGVFADFDRDGRLDLFVGNETNRERHPCELFVNLGPDVDGQLRFAETARAAGAAIVGPVKGAAAGDFDNDGWPDLYVTRMGLPNVLLRNLGTTDPPTFENRTAAAGVAAPEDAFATWFFDFDNDGWLDLFVAGFANDFVSARAAPAVEDYLGRPTTEGTGRLFRNRGDGTFEDVTRRLGLARSMLVMGANFGDIDGDGWLDLYLGTGAPDFRALVPNRLFRNDAGNNFLDVTTAAGVGHLQKGHGVAFADLDQDGDQDLFAVMGGAFAGDVYANVLFANPGHGHRFLTLNLIGTRSNRSAIGARLRLDLRTPTGRRSLHRVVGTGGSFGGSSLQQEIGLGEAVAVERLEIVWPSGVLSSFAGPEDDTWLDAHLEITEGADRYRFLERLPIPLPENPSGHDHRAHPGSGH